MFAAASGARLAKRHQPPVKKQASAGQLEGVQTHCKLQAHRIPYDGPNIPHGRRHRDLSYLDLNAKIPKLDFESLPSAIRQDNSEPSTSRSQGKAAWQDQEATRDFERHDSLENSDGNSTHRSKQKEAHRRWVKRNRIHDSSLGDCSSDEDDIYGPYGVQNAAANALLYIGLGTMAIGMIITFVGTGEKGFKTMELRLIGPSLVGAGFLTVILRIMLCVCPSRCLKKHKHKHKNSTNKHNSEEAQTSLLKKDKVKTVSIATVPSTSMVTQTPKEITATVSFLEKERAMELKPLSPPPPVKPPRTSSDISVTSLTNGLLPPTSVAVESEVKKSASTTSNNRRAKFEVARLPKNANKPGELLLCPTMLEDVQEDS